MSMVTEGGPALYRDLRITGEVAQVAEVDLARGVDLWAEKGALMSYSKGVDWKLAVPGGAGKAVGRMMAGEGLSMVHARARTEKDHCILSPNLPGKLATWDLSQGPITALGGAFVAGIGPVDISVTVAKKAGAALFGGGGLFMQRLSGQGIVLVHGYGDFVVRTLEAGEQLLVSTGNLAVFSGSVSYDVVGVGGCGRSLLGGEGLFMTQLTGPGWVMLRGRCLPVGGSQAIVLHRDEHSRIRAHHLWVSDQDGVQVRDVYGPGTRDWPDLPADAIQAAQSGQFQLKPRDGEALHIGGQVLEALP